MYNTFYGLSTNTREVVKDVVVTHVRPDFDAICSVWLLVNSLKVKYEIDAHVVFIPTKTYNGMFVNSANQYDLFENKKGTYRVWHVDTGGGALDHHHDGSGNRSASEAVTKACGLYSVEHFKEMIRQINLVEQGQSSSALSLARLIEGLHDSGLSDKQVYDAVIPFFRGILENAKLWSDAKKVHIEEVRTLSRPFTDSLIAEYMHVEGFGNVGLVCAPGKISRALVSRLWREGCLIVVVINLSEKSDEYPTVGILTNNRSTVDLAKLGIVKAIRKEEARLREIEVSVLDLAKPGSIPGMNWFAFKPEGSLEDCVLGLFNGTRKHPIMEPNDRTIISWPDIVGIVKQCLHNYVQAVNAFKCS